MQKDVICDELKITHFQIINEKNYSDVDKLLTRNVKQNYIGDETKTRLKVLTNKNLGLFLHLKNDNGQRDIAMACEKVIKKTL